MKCTVIVSASTASTFATISDRLIGTVFLPEPSDEARDVIVKELFGKLKPTEQQMAMLAAACGTHFRSIVVGAKHFCATPIWMCGPFCARLEPTRTWIHPKE